MADTASASAKGIGATLSRKVGPLPLGVWLAGGVAAVWYYEKKQGSSSATTPAATQSATGYGTDPAGNVGYIDPETGYVYGSAEDISALQSQGQVAANSYDTSGGTGDTSGDGSAAGSVDTSGATTGATTPSGTSTTTPPNTTTPPATTTTGAAAPKSSNWQYPAPTGLTFPSVTDTGFGVQFNPVTGPQGQKPGTYTVQTYQGNTKVDQFVSGSTNTREYGSGGKGLKPATTYVVNVWANGGPVAPPHVSGTVTTKPKGG
jgi:hypothetical protein